MAPPTDSVARHIYVQSAVLSSCLLVFVIVVAIAVISAAGGGYFLCLCVSRVFFFAPLYQFMLSDKGKH